jgi:hypothetical protein
MYYRLTNGAMCIQLLALEIRGEKFVLEEGWRTAASLFKADGHVTLFVSLYFRLFVRSHTR